jgi:outer membrane protein assembly factor BamB/cytochrome bd-type quinol oxidase subunit 2
VYVGSLDSKMYAFNGTTGALRWSYTMGGRILCPAAIGADGTVYAGSDDNKVYALNGSTGALRWTYTTGSWIRSSPAIGTDGSVYLGSLDNKVYALNGGTGALLWSYTTGNWVFSSPAIGADGTIYVGSYDHKVYAFNGGTGALRWSYTTGSLVVASPAIAADGSVYVGSDDNKVYAFNGGTGALLWSYSTSGWVRSSPAISADGTVYVGSVDSKVYAFNGGTGALRWSYTTGGVITSSPAIGADDTMYVLSHDHKVYALNGSTGGFRWSFTTRSNVIYTTGDIASSPAIGSDGTIYVGSDDKNVYALWCALPPTPSPSQSRTTSASVSLSASLSRTASRTSSMSSTVTTMPSSTLTPTVSLSKSSTSSVSPLPTQAAEVLAPWPGRGHDVRHSGRSPYSMAVCEYEVITRWVYNASSDIRSSAAIGADGTVYVGSYDSQIYALNGSTGAVRWNYTTGSGIYSSPALGADGTVIVGSWDSNVYALNTTNGLIRWSYATGNQIYSSPAIGADGTVYVGSLDNKVYALNGSTGALQWSYATGNQVYSSPAIGTDSTIYVGSVDSNIYALNGRTGALRWSYATGALVDSSPAIGADGTVYVGSRDSNLYALNGSTGIRRWNYTTGGLIDSSPCLGADGTVYVASSDATVYALNGSTGALRWNYTTGGSISSSPIVGADGTLYVGSHDATLYALHGSTGVLLWKHTADNQMDASPSIGADGTLYVGSNDGKLNAWWCAPQPTPSPAPSPTPPASISSTAAATSSVSVSPAQSPSSSLSPSGYAVPTATSSGSAFASLQHSVTGLSSFTASSSMSVTLPVLSANRSAAASRTPITTVSPSQFAISASLQPLSRPEQRINTSGLPSLLLVSDSLPVSFANLTISYCRAPCQAWCNVTSVGVAAVSTSVVSLPALTAQMSAVVPVWAPFDGCSSSQSALSAELVCQVHSKDAPFGPSTFADLPIECLPTRWPLLADAVLLLSTGDMFDAMLKSAWGAPMNVTMLLRDDSLPSLAAAAAQVSFHSMSGNDAVTANLNDLRPFMLPVTELSRVMLIARRMTYASSVPLPFYTDTTVRLNDVIVPATWLESGDEYGNVSLLSIQIPLQSLLCPSLQATEDCGYLQLTIAATNVVNPADNLTVALGATLSCPPFCPNDFPGTVPFAVNNDPMVYGSTSQSFMPARPQPDGAGPPIPISMVVLPSTGLYMTIECTASGFTDPLSGACINVSDPRSAICAFGAGASCVTCPGNALCPGGYRAWPVPGYYTAAESSGIVTVCPPPAVERCLGWNASASATQCGPTYLQKSYTCAACAAGYYPAPVDGTCTLCPYGGKPSAIQVLQPISVLVAVIVAVCACMYAIIFVISKTRKANTTHLLKRTLQLGVWMWITLQNVAQIGQAASPGLPPIIVSIYRPLAVLQFQGIALPSVCVASAPFLNQMLTMSSVLLGVLLTAALVWRVEVAAATAAGKRGVVRSTLYKLAIIGLTIVYPTGTNTVLDMLVCSSADISASTYATLTDDYTLVAAGGRSARTAVQVQLLLSDPSVLCYSSAHLPAAVLAWIVLIIYCIGFPVAVVLLVGSRLRALWRLVAVLPSTSSSTPPSGVTHVNQAHTQIRLLCCNTGVASEATCACCFRQQNHATTVDECTSITSDKVISPFVSGDYRPSKYWFHAVDRSQFAALAVTQSLCRNSIALAPLQLSGTLAVFAIAGWLLVAHEPYVRRSRWKSYIRLYTFSLCAVAACLNYATLTAAGSVTLVLAFVCFAGSLLLLVTLIATFIFEATILMPQPLETNSSVVSATGTKQLVVKMLCFMLSSCAFLQATTHE